ncbi:hypothetical protein PI124_g20293 [Phytophthora idaei]|nr:hypothetical protein PI125_g22252 [Phytophthora idaei]KAG3130480.1 hypothetical protein PI126_g20484 [Phytophthora idaei]KAG3234659.1 hypothetical protein PI124_g20293 [Phytophthora idaei]
MYKEVGVPSRSEDVSNHLDSLAARKEIDLTRPVRGVFSDGHSWLDVLIVAIDDAALGKRKERSESFDDASHQNNISRQFVLQSVRSLTRLRGLSHVRNQISDFVPNAPDTIDSAVREGWINVVRAYGDALPCSVDAMDEAAARGHLEVVKWPSRVEYTLRTSWRCR